MAWTPGIEIPIPAVEKGSAYIAPRVPLFTSGVDYSAALGGLLERATGIYFASSSVLYSQGRDLSTGVPRIEWARSYLTFRGPQYSTIATFSQARDYAIRALPFVETPGALWPQGREFIFEVPQPPNLLGESLMTEILYPVIPVNEVSKVLFKTDSQEWKVTEKAGAPHARRTTTLRFRVDTSAMAGFLNNLHANRLVDMRLQTPGYTPFGVNSQDNMVRLLNHSAPTREKGGQSYLLDATFLFVAVYV